LATIGMRQKKFLNRLASTLRKLRSQIRALTRIAMRDLAQG
jgi:hypothetical protein